MCAISHLFLFVSVILVFNYCFTIIHSTQLQPSFDFLSRILQQMLHDSGKYLNKLGFNFINVIIPVRILPYLEWIREIQTRKNSVFGHSRAVLRLKKEINRRICFFNCLIYLHFFIETSTFYVSTRSSHREVFCTKGALIKIVKFSQTNTVNYFQE